MRLLPTFSLLLLILSCPATAQPTRIAVASNFNHAFKALALAFEQETGQQITPVFGSTGRHYAQIVNGAPFAAFLAADSERPTRLEAEGHALPGSRFTYAIGELVLWSPDPERIDAKGAVLETNHFSRLAIANPKLAPYGRAAEQLLRKRGLWQALRTKLVRGENIAQTFQFVASGNAELGLVARSQVSRPGNIRSGSLWAPPSSLYDPIEQQAVLLKDDPVARTFFDFVRSTDGRNIIRSHGYGISDVR